MRIMWRAISGLLTAGSTFHVSDSGGLVCGLRICIFQTSSQAMLMLLLWQPYCKSHCFLHRTQEETSHEANNPSIKILPLILLTLGFERAIKWYGIHMCANRTQRHHLIKSAFLINTKAPGVVPGK